MKRIVVLFLLVLGLASPLVAQERASLLPAIPKATGAPHPEGNAWWRENHPDLLRHDRNLTVRDGNRDIQASLKGCFTCHAATTETGAVATYESDKNFCRVCHDYVAVKVDCFMCHRSTPDGVDETALNEALQAMKRPEPDRKSLLAYLQTQSGATGDATTTKEAGK